jgi:hypothetical protein
VTSNVERRGLPGPMADLQTVPERRRSGPSPLQVLHQCLHARAPASQSRPPIALARPRSPGAHLRPQEPLCSSTDLMDGIGEAHATPWEHFQTSGELEMREQPLPPAQPFSGLMISSCIALCTRASPSHARCTREERGCHRRCSRPRGPLLSLQVHEQGVEPLATRAVLGLVDSARHDGSRPEGRRRRGWP